MKPDGNCFFRALSYQLFGTEEMYHTVRTTLYHTESSNKEIFKGLIMNGVKIEEHLKTLYSPNTWATQVEVAAAASCFGIPVYYYEVAADGSCKWNVVKPLSNRQGTPIVKTPVLPSVEDVTLLRPNHLELLYFHNSHYDTIVSASTGRVCALPPPLLSTTIRYEDNIL